MDKSSMHTTFHGTKRMLCMLLILIARLVMRITVECVMGSLYAIATSIVQALECLVSLSKP